MTGADLHMLAGAYALGALDHDERSAFEEHLADCEACSVEVGEFLATAARLALASAEAPPAAMKQEVLARVAEVRQEPPTVPPAPRAPRSPSKVRRGVRFALAASVAAAVGLGGVAAWQYTRAQDAHQQAEQAANQSAQIAAVLSAPDARTVVGTVGAAGAAGQGAHAAVVTSRSQNRAVFLTAGLPQLPDAKTYQLWFDDAGVMRPAGLVAPGAGNQTVLLAGPIGPAEGMGITVEPSGGSLHPTSAPIALMPFPAS